MSDMTQSNSMLQLMQEGLEARIKADLIDRLVKKHLAAAEKELRETLKEQVEGLTLGRIERFADMTQMRDKLAVEFHWTDNKRSKEDS